MKKFLSYKHYDRLAAPRLNPDGTVARNKDGAPIYIEETSVTDSEGKTKYYLLTKVQCLDIARVIAGEGVSLYTLDWVYDIDLRMRTGYLCCLVPDAIDGGKLSSFSATNLRQQERGPRQLISSFDDATECETVLLEMKSKSTKMLSRWFTRII